MTTTNNPTTTETSMTDTMPYHWTMLQLIRYHKNLGYHFFSEGAKKGFFSRWQTIPPYKGRVFVTSEKMSWRGPRFYTVRCIRPSGGIDTVIRCETRQNAHSYAKTYAAENFARVGNESVRLPDENKMA